MSRESMQYDVVVVGGGPSGLTTAIHLKQLAAAKGAEISVCVLEKGSEIGAHILSGAVLETRTLAELFPDWKERGAPLLTPVKEDKFLFLTENGATRLPTPPQMNNHGNYIISLGNFCRWLAEQAEALGVEIYPGFAAAEILYDANGAVKGVATGDMGLDKEGQPTSQHLPGMELLGRQTVFAEGCRGSLTKQLFEHFPLREGVDPQTYGIGLKELWEIPAENHRSHRPRGRLGRHPVVLRQPDPDTARSVRRNRRNVLPVLAGDPQRSLKLSGQHRAVLRQAGVGGGDLVSLDQLLLDHESGRPSGIGRRAGAVCHRPRPIGPERAVGAGRGSLLVGSRVPGGPGCE